ncbi:MAG TPA: P27 family phage terminase small subunit [Acidobacteriaceae bacterium]|jgi:P27 family predicted phage terminase small subunit|nr:P27 family phage terminase small subunit [Acidobacteriaceae bacterium]
MVAKRAKKSKQKRIKNLSNVANDEYQRVYEQLTACKLPIDEDLLETYARAWDRHREAEENIRKDGLVTTVPLRDNHGAKIGTKEVANPHVVIAQRSESLILRLRKQMGLTAQRLTHARTAKAALAERTAEERERDAEWDSLLKEIAVESENERSGRPFRWELIRNEKGEPLCHRKVWD